MTIVGEFMVYTLFVHCLFAFFFFLMNDVKQIDFVRKKIRNNLVAMEHSLPVRVQMQSIILNKHWHRQKVNNWTHSIYVFNTKIRTSQLVFVS